MDVVFFVVFMFVLIVPELCLCYYLKGWRRGLNVREWLRS